MESTDNLFKYTFLFEYDDGTDTTVYRARSFDLEYVIKDFMAFLYDERVGFKNDVTFTLHDGAGNDMVVECKAPREE